MTSPSQNDWMDLHNAKAKLYSKNDITILPLRITPDFFSFNFTMEVSLLLDFLFNIQFDVSIDLNDFTLETLQLLFPQIQLPQFSLPPTEIFTKCKWEQSTFDNCYYDPGFGIENAKYYLKSSITSISKNMTIPDFFNSVGYSDWFRYYANRALNIIMQSIENAIILDLAILDYSSFSPEAEDGETYVPYQWLTTDPQLNQTTENVEYATIDDLLWGTVLDAMLLDLSMFTSDNSSVLGDQGAQFMDAVITAVMTNYNPFQTAVKASHFDLDAILSGNTSYFSARTEKWGEAMSIIKMIRSAVRRMLKDIVANPIMLNMYEDAMVEYCMAFQHNHDRVRHKAWANIDIESFNNAFISKWVSMGLDAQILNNLISTIGVVCRKPLPGRKGMNSPLQSQS